MDCVNEKSRAQLAKEYFLNGYNCAQAVALAFLDRIPLEKDALLMMSSSFGAGMGRLREVCGSVSGMFIVMGFISGYSSTDDKKAKSEHYARIQELGRRFEKENGSIICRELLGLSVKSESPVPQERTEQYYKKRPCAELCESAAGILENYLKEQNL